MSLIVCSSIQKWYVNHCSDGNSIQRVVSYLMFHAKRKAYLSGLCMWQKRQWMNISVLVLATFFDFWLCQRGMCRAVSYYFHQRQTVVLCGSNALRPASLLRCYSGSVVDTGLSLCLIVSNTQSTQLPFSLTSEQQEMGCIIIYLLALLVRITVCMAALYYIWQLNISGTLLCYQCDFAKMIWMCYWNNSIKWVACALDSLSERLLNSCLPREGQLRSWVMTDLWYPVE